ncbi:MAG: chalcone isomerase family protein [Thermoanaerobaculales bacterium]
MHRIVIGVLVMMLALPFAGAGSLAGVTMADRVTVSGATLHLNGMGLRKKMMFKIYVAGLYLEETTHDAAAAVSAAGTKQVVMHFLTNKATKKKMDSAWVEGFRANSSGEFKALEDRVSTFVDYFGDMKVGDVIELTIVPGEGTIIGLNGEVLGTIGGEDFAAALLRVWLGAEPPTEDLKRGMLGAG